MKYKLINTRTKEEHLCDKVTINSFDYYVNDETPEHDNYITYKNQLFIIKNGDNELFHLSKKVIATNNPNIDLPKVVDEVEKLALEYENSFTNGEGNADVDFKAGYNKSQETHPFSLEDVKEIINLAREQYWDVDNRGFSSNTEGDWSFKYSTEDEIIQKYQETKVLTIFYE